MNLVIRTAKSNLDDNVYELAELQRMDPINDYKLLHSLTCVVCGCELTFYHRNAFKREYLKTKNDEKHSPKCAQYFEREERKVVNSAGNVKQGRLNDSSLGSRLDRMSKKLLNPQKNIVVQPNGQKKKKNNKVVTSKTKRENITKILLTTDPSVSEVIGEESKNMRVPQIMANRVTDSLVGKTIILGGLLDKVEVKTSNLVLVWVSYEGKRIRIVLRQDVLGPQIGILSRLKSLKNIREKYPSDKLVIAVAGTVQISKSGELEVALLTENSMRINGNLLGVFISMYSSNQGGE